MACIHPDDRQAVQQQLQPALNLGTAVNQEFRVVWPDGSVRWLASRSVELQDDGTGRRRRIGVNWDITDSRTADIVRQERAMALRENESKSKFLARMSHELRTPLTAVLGFTQLLLQEEKGSSRAATTRRKRLEYIQSAGKHLHNLINDVLDLSEPARRRVAHCAAAGGAGPGGGRHTAAAGPVAGRPQVV
jgi:signal transduction histidine kinase